MEDMEVEFECYTVCYCLIKEERLDPTICAVKGHPTATSEDIAVGTPLGDVITRIKQEKGVHDVSWLHTRESLWKKVTDEHLAKSLPKGSVVYLKFAATGLQSLSPKPEEFSEEQVLERLLQHYRERAIQSRTNFSVLRVEDDIGQGFPITGREETYRLLLKGSAAMFKNFLRPANSLNGYRRDRPFTFGMVAFPGAGKTTIGVRGWSFLSQQWASLKESERRSLLLDELPSEEDYTRFVNLCNNSLQYNLCMYHPVEHVDGGLFDKEMNLPPRNVLALRCFAAIIQSEDYGSFLDEFERRCEGLKWSMKFSTVLKFLRKVLPGLDEETELLVPFFFDEVNAITKSADGTDVIVRGVPVEAKATWFQSMVSAYIRENYQAARSFGELKMFPVVSIATTRFSAGNLRFTESAQTFALAVPFPPLTNTQAEQVVLHLLQDWALEFGQVAPRQLGATMKTLVQLAGGMPRALARCVEATVNAIYHPDDITVRQRIFEECVTDLKKTSSLLTVINRWRGNMGLAFNGYLETDARPVLLKVLTHALTATKVKRTWCVVETGRFSHITYSDLEAAGLIALTMVEGYMELVDLAQTGLNETTEEGKQEELHFYRTRDLGEPYFAVRCIPLVVDSLLKSGSLGTDIPNLIVSDSRAKEVDDLVALLLRAYLLEASYNRVDFRLREVLPRGSIIPKALDDMRFQLYKKCYRAEHWAEQGSWRRMLSTYPEVTAFLGPGNEGPDSLLLLRTVPEGKTFHLLIQSKQTQSTSSQGFTPILTNFYDNMVSMGVRFNGLGREEFKAIAKDLNSKRRNTQLETMKYQLPSGVDDFAWIFCSNRHFSEDHVKKAKEAALGSHIILSYECSSREYQDTGSIIAAVRTLKRPFDLVR